ncbi:MAG: hypothetical protein VCC00_03120 [Deltaproteobacteria bacterium]
MRSRYSGLMMVALSLSLAVAAVAGEDVYTTSISLSDTKPGAAVSVVFRFSAKTDAFEKVDRIEVQMPAGTVVNGDGLSILCYLESTDSDAGEICAKRYASAKLGSGTLTTSSFGRHTVVGDAYVVDTGNTPGGANLVFFFPSGQVFGVGAQTIFGTLEFHGGPRPKMVMENIQDQLSLPFGMTARIISNEFKFVGQAGEPVYRNPEEGDVESWDFAARLTWSGGGQVTTMHAPPAP